MTTKRNKSSRAARAGKLIAGMRKHFTSGGQLLTFASALADHSVDGVVADLQEIVDNRAAAVTALAAARDRVQAERAAAPRLMPLMSAVEALARFMFGNDTTALADFGLEPHKQPAPRTAEEKAIAVAKSKATRVARGTKGPKARLAIHGDVTAKLVVTPVGGTPTKAPLAGSGGGDP